MSNVLIPWELRLETTGETVSATTPAWLGAILRECVQRPRGYKVVGLKVFGAGAGTRNIEVPLANGVPHTETANVWLHLLLARLSAKQSTAAVRWASDATKRRALPIAGVVTGPATPVVEHKVIAAVVPPSPLRVSARLEDWVGGIIHCLPSTTRAAIFKTVRDIRFQVRTPGHYGMRLDMPPRFGGPRASS